VLSEVDDTPKITWAKLFPSMLAKNEVAILVGFWGRLLTLTLVPVESLHSR
jgi:hypothetical protein